MRSVRSVQVGGAHWRAKGPYHRIHERGFSRALRPHDGDDLITDARRIELLVSQESLDRLLLVLAIVVDDLQHGCHVSAVWKGLGRSCFCVGKVQV